MDILSRNYDLDTNTNYFLPSNRFFSSWTSQGREGYEEEGPRKVKMERHASCPFSSLDFLFSLFNLARAEIPKIYNSKILSMRKQ